MRALADAIDWPGIPGEPNTATPEKLSEAAIALRYAAAELEALRRPQTMVIDDPVAGRIEQRVRQCDGSPNHLADNQMARFAEISKQFPTSEAIARAWDKGWQSGWANRHKAIPDADGRVGLSSPIDNPYAS